MNKEIKELIEEFKKDLTKIEPLENWTASSNYPFDIQIKKPRHSLSKHTDTRPTSWEYNDGVYMLRAVHSIPKLIAEIERLSNEKESTKD
jgi:hypothetical protein